MTSLNLYRVYCTVEEIYINTWDIVEPTTCPNNNTHAISSNIDIIDEVSTSNITVNEDTDGYFETTTVSMLIPSGLPGSVTEHDVSWPMNILVWNTHITPTTPMIDDSMSVIASPETIIGVLTVGTNIGDTVLNVNSTVIDNAYGGFLVTLDDGVNKDVVNRISGIDSINSQITVETPLSYAYSPGTPFKISIYLLKDIFIANTNEINIGQKGFRGKQLDANVPLRVYYTNNSGTEKTIKWRPEYYNLGL